MPVEIGKERKEERVGRKWEREGESEKTGEASRRGAIFTRWP